MREILFRGKRTDNGEWVEGDLVHSYFKVGDTCINASKENLGFYEVDPSTVDQYTGLCDKNGKKIFEGDIVRHYNHTDDADKYEIGMVFFNSQTACFKRTGNPASLFLNARCIYEVIGNCHDNPELLEG